MNANDQPSRLLFLGTGAADWPALPEDAPFPQPTSYRSNAALLVDGHILVDGGPRLMPCLRALRLDAGAISDLLITHSHSDHYNAAQVSALAAVPRQERLRIWYPDGAQLGLDSFAAVELHPLLPGDTARPAGYEALALAANHLMETTSETALMYLFNNTACRWLYATDGSWLLIRSWRRLRAERALDALLIDATLGDVTDDWRIFEHNSLPMVRQMTAAMRRWGVLAPDAVVVLTHLARDTHLPPGAMAARDSVEGWVTALDGMELTVPVHS